MTFYIPVVGFDSSHSEQNARRSWIDAESVVQRFGLSLGWNNKPFLFFGLLLPLMFPRFHNLNGWLDALLQGLLGFFLFSAEILFSGLTIYLIPSVQRALGGTVPKLRTL